MAYITDNWKYLDFRSSVQEMVGITLIYKALSSRMLVLLDQQPSCIILGPTGIQSIGYTCVYKILSFRQVDFPVFINLQQAHLECVRLVKLYLSRHRMPRCSSKCLITLYSPMDCSIYKYFQSLFGFANDCFTNLITVLSM